MKNLLKKLSLILLVFILLFSLVPTVAENDTYPEKMDCLDNSGTTDLILSAQNVVEFQPYTSTTPASFNNVTYKTRAGVMKANGMLTGILKDSRLGDELGKTSSPSTLAPVEKLKQNTFVKSSVMAAKLPGYKKGTIILDETSGIAAKVVNEIKAGENVASDSVMLARPQINEVLEDINITQQTVTLNTGNIGGMPTGVKQSIVSRVDDKLPDMEKYSAGNLINLLNAKTPETKLISNKEYGTHIKHPLIEFEFNDIPLAAYDANGVSVMVKLNGYIGIDSINVTGHYSFMGGYEFVATTGEEIDLKVTSAMNIKQEIVIPLFGIDIPAGIAHASGGLFLVVGMNGNFTLVTEATQWLSVKAGIQGGTFFGVPTGFNPVFDPIDKGFDVDVAFFGSINGYIKAGPMVQLQLFGWDVAGAGVLGGAGLTCSTDNSVISADAYATLEVYALLLGTRLNLLNSKIVLLQLRGIPDTKGYSIQYYNVDAYDGIIWGKISKDYGGNIGIKEFSGDIVVQVLRNGVEMGKHTTHSDSKGIFCVQDINNNEKLYKGDQIKVISAGGDDINSLAVNPTIPFNEVLIDYADYFNDSALGHVTSAVIKNWSTGEKKTVNFNGTIAFTVMKDSSEGGGTYTPPAVTSSTDGVFNLYNNDFKPKDKIKAILVYNNFTVDSVEAPTSVDLIAQRVMEDKGTSEYTENGRVIQKRSEKEYFFIYNKRGSKQVDQSGTYTGTYRYYDKNCYVVDPKTGQQLVLAKQVGEKTFSQTVSPQGPGCSLAEKNFITEWGWSNKSVRNSNRTLSTPSTSTTSPSRLQLPLPLLDVISFRYESGMYKEDYDAIKDEIERPNAGVDSIRKKGVLTIEYEGAKITIEDPNDNAKKGKGKKTVYAVDPFARSISEIYWDRIINPLEIATNQYNSIANETQLATWARTQAKSMVKMGIMNTGKQGIMKANTPISRGEFTAFLTRALKMAPTFGNNSFTDVAAFYPYRYEINTAVKYGFMGGTSSTKFSPFSSITREQAAAITMNALKKMLGSKLAIPSSSRNIKFKDTKSITASRLTAVNELSSLGLMYKNPDGNFRPKNNLTYEDTSYLLEKVYSKMK